jgi:hypothetical protein|uniref:Uncharacterized protein n=1 Tax=Siphoviridae sp. ctSqC25 TaxID=2823582 RepID=A0A8S5L694_9CAUD|nr:MAG TPA: hypothetical protein [Siphoviridae sp. ctSqC25]
MYSTKEKLYHFRQLANPLAAEADLALLHEKNPQSTDFTRFDLAPCKNAEDILFALLDVADHDDIVRNRREFFSTQDTDSNDNPNPDADGGDGNPSPDVGGNNENPDAGGSDDNPNPDADTDGSGSEAPDDDEGQAADETPAVNPAEEEEAATTKKSASPKKKKKSTRK